MYTKRNMPNLKRFENIVIETENLKLEIKQKDIESFLINDVLVLIRTLTGINVQLKFEKMKHVLPASLAVVYIKMFEI